MSLWVIIPVKPLNRAKSRLAEVLTPDERSEFAEAMLRQILTVVATVPQVTGTLVISRDGRALTIAREYGARTVQESGAPELNLALMRATEVVRSWGCEAILILPADLPFVSAQDITTIIEKGQRVPSVVIATDRDQNGTNALLVRPPGLIDYQYGEDSFHHHLDQARELGATIAICESERLLLDIDVPEDLELYNRMVQRGGYSGLPLVSLNGANKYI